MSRVSTFPSRFKSPFDCRHEVSRVVVGIGTPTGFVGMPTGGVMLVQRNLPDMYAHTIGLSCVSSKPQDDTCKSNLFVQGIGYQFGLVVRPLCH